VIFNHQSSRPAHGYRSVLVDGRGVGATVRRGVCATAPSQPVKCPGARRGSVKLPPQAVRVKATLGRGARGRARGHKPISGPVGQKTGARLFASFLGARVSGDGKRVVIALDAESASLVAKLGRIKSAAGFVVARRRLFPFMTPP